MREKIFYHKILSHQTFIEKKTEKLKYDHCTNKKKCDFMLLMVYFLCQIYNQIREKTLYVTSDHGQLCSWPSIILPILMSMITLGRSRKIGVFHFLIRPTVWHLNYSVCTHIWEAGTTPLFWHFCIKMTKRISYLISFLFLFLIRISRIWGIFLVKTLEEELCFSKGLPFLWLYWLYYFLPFCYLKWLIWLTALTLSSSHMHQLILYPPPFQGPFNTSNLFYPTSCFSKLVIYLLIQSFSSSLLFFLSLYFHIELLAM